EGLGKEDVTKQGRVNAIYVDEDITLVNDQNDAEMFDVNTLTGDEVIVDVGSRNISLHRIKHEIGTRNEKERSCSIERKKRERDEIIWKMELY
ncbi:hypothetical protein Tco_0202128, partial [Tanacetum coccineum]